MKCRGCNRPIPPSQELCRNCEEEQFKRQIREFQKEHLDVWVCYDKKNDTK